MLRQQGRSIKRGGVPLAHTSHNNMTHAGNNLVKLAITAGPGGHISAVTVLNDRERQNEMASLKSVSSSRA